MNISDVKKALDEAAAASYLLPVQRTIGSGIAVQHLMVMAIPVDLWENLVVSIDYIQDEAEV